MKIRKLTAAALAAGIIVSLTLAPELSPLSSGGMYTAGAENDLIEMDNFTYKVDEEKGEATIVAYRVPDDNEITTAFQKTGILTIPDTFTIGTSANSTTYSVVAIGEKVFQNKKKIKEIRIADTVTNIDPETFWNCVNLESILINNSSHANNVYKTRDGVLYSYSPLDESEELICYPMAKTDSEFVASRELKAIHRVAFARASHLESVKLNEGLETIGDMAFGRCTGLTTIEIPGSETKLIGDKVFTDAPNVKIICKSGSKAQQYADGHGIQCVLSDPTSLPELTGLTATFDIAEDMLSYEVTIKWDPAGDGYKYHIYHSTDPIYDEATGVYIYNEATGDQLTKTPISDTEFHHTPENDGKYHYYFVSVYKKLENGTVTQSLPYGLPNNINAVPLANAVQINGYAVMLGEKSDKKYTEVNVELLNEDGSNVKNKDGEIIKALSGDNGFNFYVKDTGKYKLRFTTDGIKNEQNLNKIRVVDRIYEIDATKIKGNEVVGELLRYGDIDGNGKIEPDDAVLILLEVANLDEATALDPYKKDAADINRNGAVGADDATAILKYLCEKYEESALTKLRYGTEGEG